MSTERDPLSRFLERLKTASRSEAVGEYSERLLWTTLCRQLLNGLTSEGFVVSEELQVPVGMAARTGAVATILRPDFTVSKDEVRLFIFLDIESETGQVNSSTLRQYQKTLVNSALTSGVVHAWRGNEIPSASLDIIRISKIDVSEKNVELGPVLPITECIREFYARSFVGDWELEGLETLKAQKSGLNTLPLVEEALRIELERLKKRQLKRWDRKEAQALIDEKVVERVIEVLRRSLFVDKREDIRKSIERIVGEKTS